MFLGCSSVSSSFSLKKNKQGFESKGHRHVLKAFLHHSFGLPGERWPPLLSTANQNSRVCTSHPEPLDSRLKEIAGLRQRTAAELSPAALGPRAALAAGQQSVLVQVGRSALVLDREGFEALVDLLVLGSLLRLLLRVGEAGGDARCRSTVAGCCPHGGLQELHGVAPLPHRAAQRVQSRALPGQRAADRGGVLPGCLWWPGFGFVILRTQRELVWGWGWFPGGCCWFRTKIPLS